MSELLNNDDNNNSEKVDPTSGTQNESKPLPVIPEESVASEPAAIAAESDGEEEEEDEDEEKAKVFESNIMPFKAIHSFVTALNTEFGEKDKQLRLYARLIEQTTFSHELPIRKHVQAFNDFCIHNRDAIFAKKVDALVKPKISYSERVYIDISALFNLADNDQKVIMWQHILTISALVDPTGRAKQLLKNAKSSKEGNFLNKIIEKVEQSTAANTSGNPMEMIGNLVNSGIVSDLMGSLNNQGGAESLDFGKMMGLVQNMIGTFTKDQPELQQLMGTVMKGMENIKMPNANNQSDANTAD